MSNDNSDLSKQPPQVSNEAETAPAQNPSESEVAKTNFNQTLEYTASIPELVAGEEIADMPTSNIEGIREVLTKVTDPKLAEGEQGAKWFSTLNGGAEANVFGDGFSKTLAREDALFEQTVKSEVGDLKAGTPKFNSKQGTKYTGEAALIRIKSSLGLGTAFTVPLWHSGFWVTLKSPQFHDCKKVFSWQSCKNPSHSSLFVTSFISIF